MSRDPSAPEIRAFPGARLRAPHGTRLINGLITGLVLLITTAMIAIPELRTSLGVLAALLALPMTLAMLQFRSNSPRAGGNVEVSDEGVHVEGRMALPIETLVRAVVARDARGSIVSIQRKKGFTAVLDVASEDEGKALVEALGLAPSQALSDFSFDSPVTARLSGPLFTAYLAALSVGVMVLAKGGMAWLALLFGTCAYAGLIAMAVQAKLTVGLDGLLVRWAWRREIIPFTDLRDVAHDEHRLVLTLANGRTRSLSVRWMGDRFTKRGVSAAGFPSREAYLDAVVTRVRDAIAASRRPAAPMPATALQRQGREVSVWIRGLRGLLDRGTPGFRAAETVPEQLWSTVEDGGADPASRAAAAIALTPALDADDRQRLLRIARVVVSPKLRIALEAAADDDEAAVTEALAALEQARGEKRAG